MIWFTADTHFNHKKMYDRPFSDIGEHDAELMKNWNSCVRPGDTVYVIGDFIWYKTNFEAYLEQLNGEIHLIPGDHDSALLESSAIGNVIVHDLIHEVRARGIDIILCHWPLAIWPKSHYGSIHLHGHLHSVSIPQWGRRMNVGVDVNNYFPISLDEVVLEMERLPQNPNFINPEARRGRPEKNQAVKSDDGGSGIAETETGSDKGVS